MSSRFRRALILAWLALAGGFATEASPEPPRPRTLDDCESLVRAQPDSFDSYYCFWGVARRDRSFDDAARRLEARLNFAPDDQKARLYLGLIAADRGDPRAVDLLERAARGFQDQGEATGEVYARQSLVRLHEREGRRDQAEQELVQLSAAAERSGDPALVVRAELQEAWHAQGLNDHGRAYLLFRRAHERLAPGMPPDLPGMVLDGLAACAYTLDRFEESATLYRTALALAVGRGDRYTEADIRLWLWMLDEQLGARPEDLATAAREALAAARSAGSRSAEAYALLLVGRSAPGAAAREHLVAAAELARQAGTARAQVMALGELGTNLALDPPADAAAGLLRLDEAARLAEASGNADLAVEARAETAVVLLRLGRDEEARHALAAALRELDRVRDRQPEASTRARVVSRFAPAFGEAAGLLLQRAHDGDDGEALETALTTLERLRSQQLRERLGSGRFAGPASSPARDQLLAEIARNQRRLAGANLGDAEREQLLRDLDALETRELEQRDGAAREGDAGSGEDLPAENLAALQRALGPDQALLYFALAGRAGRSGPGSWVIALHRAGASVHPVPDRQALEEKIAMLRALVERRDGSESAGAVALFQELLARSLASLPPTTRRLVIVPDGPLFALPFDLLAPAPGAAPVAMSHSVTLAPSALVWRAAGRQPARGPGGVLALGDPELSGGARPIALSREGTLLGVAALGRLPHARAELASIRRVIGDLAVIREGAEATEHAVKSGDLERFGVLHLAAHAVVEERRPERSAIVLGPGPDAEDGLLQAREIAALPLSGQAVVLSACRSATGELLASEGPVGLSHAFFLAGSRAVVGSLWPVRDTEVVPLIRAFYEQLALGSSLEQALAAAHRERIEAGIPAADWAGLVLLGDGQWVPFPGGVRRGGAAARSLPLLLAAAAAALAAAGLALSRRSAARSARARARRA
ncbi:MAG: CHAT domain-containing protein [Acidobacteria bacterium]|nr:CHAT domain-containing protein [Acidobacteriota bacterium]